MRRLVRILIFLCVLATTYRLILLPWLMSWGATNEELKRSLPGDELVLYKGYQNTLAITINAPPSRIWPWVAQMGLHKGGFYSHTALENLFGCRLKNANRIYPQWQQPRVGEIEPVCASQEGKPGAGWRIALVRERQALVWQGRDGAQWMMGVFIDSVDVHASRLITRQQFQDAKPWSGSWLLEKLWLEWAHCIMQRGMLQGIKKRVEQAQAEGRVGPR